MRKLNKDGKTVFVAQTKADAEHVLKLLREFRDNAVAEHPGAAPVALDFETTALRAEDHPDARVRLTSISFSPNVAYVIDHDKSIPFAIMADDLINESPYFVFNANFEGRWFGEYVSTVTGLTRQILDIAHMQRAVMGGGPLWLKTMVKKVCKVDLDKSEQNSDWSNQNLTASQYFYSGLDSIYTREVAVYWNGEMTSDHWRGFHVLNDAWRAVNECEDTGLLLDEVHHEKLVRMWERRRQSAEKSFRKFVPENIVANIRSKLQISNMLKMLLDDDAIAEWPKTEKTAQLQTSRNILRSMSYVAPYPASRIMTALMVFNRADKYIGTYGETLLNKQRMSPDGRIHGRLNMAAAITGRFSSSNPNCFTGEHELLTRTGWVRCDEYAGQEIMQWSSEDGSLQFVAPTNWIDRNHKGKVISIDGPMVRAVVTPEHRFVAMRDGRAKVYTAAQIAASSGLDGIPTSGRYEKDGRKRGAWVQFAVALAADGTERATTLDFGFKKERKIKRLQKILDALGYTYRKKTGGSGVTYFYVDRQVGQPSKGFDSWCMDLSSWEMDILLNEAVHWDGFRNSNNGAVTFATMRKEQALWLQTIAHIRNRPVTVKQYKTGIWNVYFRSSTYTSVCDGQATEEQYEGKVYCPTVPSGFVLVRNDNRVYVAGNCQNFPRHPAFRFGFMAGLGRKLIIGDYSGVEIRVLAELSGDQILLHDAVYGDVHAMSAIAIYEVDAKDYLRILKHNPAKDAPLTQREKSLKVRYKEMRSKAKAFTFQLLYGAGPGALAIALRCTVDEAVDAINKWAARYKKAYHYRQIMFEQMNHSGFMPCASGRTVFVHRNERSMPVAANYPIQGSAGDVMYRAMTRTQEQLDKAGIDAVLMVSVHDELLVLSADHCAEQALVCLNEGMRQGWLDIFPGSNTDHLADAEIGDRWSDK